MNVLVQQAIVHEQFTNLRLQRFQFGLQCLLLHRLPGLKGYSTVLEKGFLPRLQQMRRLPSRAADFFQWLTIEQRNRHLRLAIRIPALVFPETHRHLQLHQHKQSKGVQSITGVIHSTDVPNGLLGVLRLALSFLSHRFLSGIQGGPETLSCQSDNSVQLVLTGNNSASLIDLDH